LQVTVAQGTQIDDSGNKSLHPIKTANTPACMIAYDDKVQSEAFMTAGGAYADFVHSPFFISSNYPETQSSWTTEMSNDRNYQTYYTQHYQRYLHSSGCDGNGNNCDHGTKEWRGLWGVAGNDYAQIHSVINYQRAIAYCLNLGTSMPQNPATTQRIVSPGTSLYLST